MEKPRLKGLLHVSDNWGGGDYTAGRVVRLESSGKILGAPCEIDSIYIYINIYIFMFVLEPAIIPAGSILVVIDKGVRVFTK